MGDTNTDILDDHTMDLKGNHQEEPKSKPERLTTVAGNKGQGERPGVVEPCTQSEGGSHGSDDGLASLKDAAVEGEDCTMEGTDVKGEEGASDV
ncbi:uncharacterized protein PG998_010923 [Apiospora kogelbergensis]|uniref:uncharacterized protein n=1 Tax=Apiospora kogelbergensis TaxID=1337665 RepID=UPI00313090DC